MIRPRLANPCRQNKSLSAVEDGLAAYEELLAKLADVPTPAGPTPRQLRGAPLVQIEFPREADERQKAKKASTAGAIHG